MCRLAFHKIPPGPCLIFRPASACRYQQALMSAMGFRRRSASAWAHWRAGIAFVNGACARWCRRRAMRAHRDAPAHRSMPPRPSCASWYDPRQPSAGENGGFYLKTTPVKVSGSGLPRLTHRPCSRKRQDILDRFRQERSPLPSTAMCSTKAWMGPDASIGVISSGSAGISATSSGSGASCAVAMASRRCCTK